MEYEQSKKKKQAIIMSSKAQPIIKREKVLKAKMLIFYLYFKITFLYCNYLRSSQQ